MKILLHSDIICNGGEIKPIIYIEGVLIMEKTFLMVKPDGVQRNLIGEIVGRFENKGYQLVGAKLMKFQLN